MAMMNKTDSSKNLPTSIMESVKKSIMRLDTIGRKAILI